MVIFSNPVFLKKKVEQIVDNFIRSNLHIFCTSETGTSGIFSGSETISKETITVTSSETINQSVSQTFSQTVTSSRLTTQTTSLHKEICKICESGDSHFCDIHTPALSTVVSGNSTPIIGESCTLSTSSPSGFVTKTPPLSIKKQLVEAKHLNVSQTTQITKTLESVQTSKHTSQLRKSAKSSVGSIGEMPTIDVTVVDSPDSDAVGVEGQGYAEIVVPESDKISLQSEEAASPMNLEISMAENSGSKLSSNRSTQEIKVECFAVEPENSDSETEIEKSENTALDSEILENSSPKSISKHEIAPLKSSTKTSSSECSLPSPEPTRSRQASGKSTAIIVAPEARQILKNIKSAVESMVKSKKEEEVEEKETESRDETNELSSTEIRQNIAYYKTEGNPSTIIANQDLDQPSYTHAKIKHSPSSRREIVTLKPLRKPTVRSKMCVRLSQFDDFGQF